LLCAPSLAVVDRSVCALCRSHSGFTAVPVLQQRLLAFGGFFMYLTVTQYLKYNARFFLLIGTLRRGLPNIFR
jgi:hypothetical protein